MSSIDEYYGGSVFGVKGKESVALCTDLRLGNSFQTQTMNVPKVQEISRYGLLGLTAFLPDCIEFGRRMKYESEIYRLNEGREIRAPQLTRLVSSALYERRLTGGWYVAPIIAGIDDAGRPYLASMDGLGATTDGDNWVASGTAHNYMLGPAQHLFQENMDEPTLIAFCTDVMQAALNRDAYSGWGIRIFTLGPNGINVHDVPCRMD